MRITEYCDIFRETLIITGDIEITEIRVRDFRASVLPDLSNREKVLASVESKIIAEVTA